MKRHRSGSLVKLLAVLFGLSLVAAACGDDDNGGDDEGAAGSNGGGALECDTVSIGMIPGWDEGEAATYLWKVILEDEGATVDVTELDAGPVYQGVATGDLDLFLDAWLPTTHEDYWEELGDDLEDLGVWYDQATLNLAVPEYVDIETIGDLADRADEFGGRIVGIDPGAGLMRVTRDEAMPTYGLEDFDLVEGSATAMLAELQRAIDDEEPIVVTLWHPHWAYAAFPIKDLEDPEGAMGGAESMHVAARSGFGEDCPTIAGWLTNFEMDDASLASLEELVINEYGDGEEEDAVREWLEDSANQELVDSWKS